MKEEKEERHDKRQPREVRDRKGLGRAGAENPGRTASGGRRLEAVLQARVRCACASLEKQRIRASP